MSEIKVNKISPATGTETTLGDASDDFLLPSGAEIIAQSGSTITVASGATITNAGTATNFGGGAWDRLASTGSGTTVSNTDINGYFTSDYDVYKIFIINLIASGNTTLQFQVATTGSYTVQTSNDYHTSQNYNPNNAASLGVNGYQSSAQYECGHIGSSATLPTTTEIVIFKPTSTTHTKDFHSNQLGNYNGARYFQNCAGFWGSTTAITGIRFKVASGTITYDNMHLYGIKNS